METTVTATGSIVDWHNTGSNGRATAVWCARDGKAAAEIRAMPFRCLVDLYYGGQRCIEGEPFPTLDAAKAYAADWLTR